MAGTLTPELTDGAAGYLTVKETAERLAMHYMSVYKLVQSGALPALKLGSRWKIDPAELDRWLDQRRGRQRRWLLLGDDDHLARQLASLAPARRQIERLGYDQLGRAIASRPSGLLLDTAADWHVALAAAGACRAQSPVPFCALLVEQPTAAQVAEALDAGPVSLLPRRLTDPLLTQLEESLGWA